MIPGPVSGERADTLALGRLLGVRPELCGLERARERLGLRSHELLHAGPPLADPRAPCAPLANAAATAALLEGWAQTPDEAAALVRDGRISFKPAQDALCVLPLADVLSPSMWVQVVRDANAPARWACSPLHGGAAHAMRVGVFNAEVLARLVWLDAEFAPALRNALAAPVALIALADQGLAAGDDCHGKTASASSAFAALMHDRLNGDHAAACRNFLAHSPGYFLNLWMAACKCMLSAAVGMQGSGVVTAAAGNGIDFGIQVAGLPGRWFTLPATPPLVPQAPPEVQLSSLGAIGDSALVDLLGFGAMTTLDACEQPAAGFATLWPHAPCTPRDLLGPPHPAFVRTQARVGVRASKVAAAGCTPVVSLGVLDKTGERGRLAGGYYKPPAQLFAEAQAAVLRA